MADHFDTRIGEWIFKAIAALVLTWLVTQVLSMPEMQTTVESLKERAAAPRFTRDDGDVLRQTINDLRLDLSTRITAIECMEKGVDGS